MMTQENRQVANQHALAATAGLITVLFVQSFHMIEHVAQVLQKFVLGQPEAHGLLGTIFDFEWVHFVYNTSLEIALLLVFIWCRRAMALRVPRSLRGVVWFQGYHVVEHVVRMFQYYIGGVTSPKGILGFVFPVIWLHFWINLIILALIVVLIVGDREVMDAYSDRSGLEAVSPVAIGSG